MLGETLSYLYDYVSRRVAMEGQELDFPFLLSHPAPQENADSLAKLCLKFEREYLKSSGLFPQLKQVTFENMPYAMQRIQAKLFEDGFTSGRIIGLFASVGLLAVHCVKEKRMHLVNDIILSVGAYFHDERFRLNEFLDANDGWNFVLEHPKVPNTCTKNVLIAAGVCILVFGCWWLQK